jgi:hypothetical protein
VVPGPGTVAGAAIGTCIGGFVGVLAGDKYDEYAARKEMDRACRMYCKQRGNGGYSNASWSSWLHYYDKWPRGCNDDVGIPRKTGPYDGITIPRPGK